jgi:NADPH:quinone reductase-like Zn-dependent oxidoreductase
MKAVLWTGYGGPGTLEVADVDVPAPADDEVRIRVHATTVSAGDCEVRSLRLRFPLSILLRFYFGPFRPKRVRVLGQELAGVIDAVGTEVHAFEVGDEVFAQTDFTMGAYAEYRCFRAVPGEDQGLIARKPSSLSFEQAAALPLGGLEALKYLRAAELQPGERVLIIGSGGSIGTVAIQVAKHFECHVTGVDRSDKLPTMRDCGADEVIDYAAEDVTARAAAFDVVFDVVGKTPYRLLLSMLEDNGRLTLSNPRMAQMMRGTRTTKEGKRIIVGTQSRPEDLATLAGWAEEGIVRPVIDRTYPLDQVAEAHRYVESGAKKGSLVVIIGGG